MKRVAFVGPFVCILTAPQLRHIRNIFKQTMQWIIPNEMSRIDVKDGCWRHDLRIIPGSGNGVFGRCWQVGIVLKDLLFCIILTMNMCILCRFAMVWCYRLKCSLLYEEMVMSSFPRRFFPMNLRWTVRFTLYRIYAQLSHNFPGVTVHWMDLQSKNNFLNIKDSWLFEGMKSYTQWYEVLIA